LAVTGAWGDDGAGKASHWGVNSKNGKKVDFLFKKKKVPTLLLSFALASTRDDIRLTKFFLAEIFGKFFAA
jgi:hypothetical protein